MVTLQAKIFDANGVACLDAATLVRFDKLGDAQLLDNLGTSTGSRAVQLYNGRAIIKTRLSGTQAVFSLSSADLETQYLTLKK
jgi:beta-galactosidase